MKSNKNCKEIVTKDGSIILISYKTPVAGILKNDPKCGVKCLNYFDEAKKGIVPMSRTSNKHIRAFFANHKVEKIHETNSRELQAVINDGGFFI